MAANATTPNQRAAVALAYGRRLTPAQKKQGAKAQKLSAIQPLRKVRY